MRIGTIIICLLLLTAIFTGCQAAIVDKSTDNTGSGMTAEDKITQAGQLDIIAEDDVDIGELI